MKEAEVRNRDVLNEYMKILYQDTLALFNTEEFETICCPACNQAEDIFEFEKMGFKYVQCKECKTLYVNPRPQPEILNRFYSNSASTDFWVKKFFTPIAETRRDKIFKPRAEYITKQFPSLRNSKIGDIGAGFGLFLEELQKLWPAANYIAIEPSDEMANICKTKNLTVIPKVLENLDAESDGGFDLLTAFELFEHLHSPNDFIRKVHSLLNPGGFLMLTTLNGQGFDIQLLWENSKSILPPQHINFFNIKSICALLISKGFKILSKDTPGQLDWDIVEGMITQEGIDLGRFWETIINTDEKTKSELQKWISGNNLSSHMRVIAQKI